MKTIPCSLAIFSLLLTGAFHAGAQEVPASGELFSFKEEDLGTLKLRFEATATIDKSDSSPALKVEIPVSEKYPGVAFIPSGGEWDLSAFKGLEAEVSNVGSSRLALTLRVDNQGNGAPDTWNAEAAALGPGETKVIRVTFGKTWGKEGAALDTAHIVETQIFATGPGEDGTIIIRSLKAVP